MPRHKSAKKRMHTNARDTAKNRAVTSHVRVTVKEVRAKSSEGDAGKKVALASSVLDRAVRKGVIKKATANRQKARIARALRATG